MVDEEHDGHRPAQVVVHVLTIDAMLHLKCAAATAGLDLIAGKVDLRSCTGLLHVGL